MQDSQQRMTPQKFLRATDSSFSWPCQRCSIFESCSSRCITAWRITSGQVRWSVGPLVHRSTYISFALFMHCLYWIVLNCIGMFEGSWRSVDCKNWVCTASSLFFFSCRAGIWCLSPFTCRWLAARNMSQKSEAWSKRSKPFSQDTRNMASIFKLSCFRASASSLLFSIVFRWHKARDETICNRSATICNNLSRPSMAHPKLAPHFLTQSAQLLASQW